MKENWINIKKTTNKQKKKTKHTSEIGMLL